MYTKLLQVSTPEGKRISANINRTGNKVFIGVDYLKIVEKDNPSFAEKGIIKISCDLSKYSKTIKLLTQYFEDLFLKGMADENIYTGLGIKSKSRRTKRKDTKREVGNSKREGSSSSVHAGARGDESSESTGRGYTAPKMAEGRDSPIGGKDSSGN